MSIIQSILRNGFVENPSRDAKLRRVLRVHAPDIQTTWMSVFILYDEQGKLIKREADFNKRCGFISKRTSVSTYIGL